MACRKITQFITSPSILLVLCTASPLRGKRTDRPRNSSFLIANLPVSACRPLIGLLLVPVCWRTSYSTPPGMSLFQR